MADKIINDNTSVSAGDGIVEGFGPVLSVLADNYCENLVNPEESKRIEPKKMYITLGSVFGGAILFFLLLGWLLCYAPLNTTGVPVEDFIREFNAIEYDPALNDSIDTAVGNFCQENGISFSDVTIAYPDFSDIYIPEDANLKKGVYLCGDNLFMQADVVGGKIQKLTLSLSDKCHHYDRSVYKFSNINGSDFDYAPISCHAAIGMSRIALYGLLAGDDAVLPDGLTCSDAIAYCSSMWSGAIYSFADAEDYSVDQSYFEYIDNAMLYFVPKDFEFVLDTRDRTLSGEDNGIYRFFDSLFGEKEEKVPAAEDATPDAAEPETTATTPAVTSGSEAAQ